MATAELARPQEDGRQQEVVVASGNAVDGVVIHPYLYPHTLVKLAIVSNKGQLKKQLRLAGGLSKQEEKEGVAYVTAVDAARAAFNSALESAAASDDAVAEAARSYISLLLGLLSSNSTVRPEITTTTVQSSSPDGALSAAEQGSSSPHFSASAKLRSTVRFEWSEALISPPAGMHQRTAAAQDACYELASVFIAVSVRVMRAAAAACSDSASGVPTPASTRGYQLLRRAAGMLEWAAQHVLPVLPNGVSVDTDMQLVRGLTAVALADAQQLTMLRAVAKGNQPLLVACLAVDTAALYGQACSQLVASSVRDAHTSKLWQYGQYKQVRSISTGLKAYCLAYAHCFNGISLWKGKDQCGKGLSSLAAAAAQLARAASAAAAYDAAPPASLNLHHRRADEEVARLLADTQRRMDRENRSVYLQPVPAEVPPLPEGKRLVASLPYSLPQPASVVKDGVPERCLAASAPLTEGSGHQSVHSGTAGTSGPSTGAATHTTAASSGGQEPHGGATSAQQGGSLGRWFLLTLCTPLLAVLWVVGAIIWVLLLPLKCCCPCCGLPLQWAADLVLWLMKAPARALLWAAGKQEHAGSPAASNSATHNNGGGD